MPTVSVIIPLYNKEPYISRTLNSVLCQTFQDFEIIVVDDGSTDKSAEMVKSFTDPRILLIQQENKGVSVARNRGVKESNSNLITFLDADDEWEPKFLETILRLKENYPNAGLYSTAYKVCGQYGKMINFQYQTIPSPPWEGVLSNYFNFVTLDYSLITSAVGVPKEIFIELGAFSPGIRWSEDTDMWGRIALKYKIAFSTYIGAIYHHDVVNNACQKKIQIEEHSFVRTASLAIKDGTVPIEMLNDLREYIAVLKIMTAKQNLLLGYNTISLKMLRNCETKLFYRKKVMLTILSLIPSTIFLLLRRLINYASN